MSEDDIFSENQLFYRQTLEFLHLKAFFFRLTLSRRYFLKCNNHPTGISTSTNWSDARSRYPKPYIDLRSLSFNTGIHLFHLRPVGLILPKESSNSQPSTVVYHGIVQDLRTSLYAIHLGQMISTVLGQDDHGGQHDNGARAPVHKVD